MIKRFLYTSLFSIFYTSLVLFTYSCEKDKLKTPAASYIVVNTATVNSGNRGLIDSHKITDIWLYVNDRFQGVYPIGSLMPVLSSGTATVKMYSGIMNNGISDTRLPYTFYNPYVFAANFEEHKTYTIIPDFHYKEGITIVDDNFNGSLGSLYSPPGNSIYTLTADPSKVWGGSGKSVYVSMSDSIPTAIIQSSAPQYLPVGGAAVYLELDYKANQEISVGLDCGGGIEKRNALTLRPTSDWKKVYISLTSAASTQPTYNYYKVYISAIKQSGLEHPEMYLDNIRLVMQ